VELIGGRAGGEPDDAALEDQRQPSARAQPGLHQAVLVGDGRAQRRPDVGQPPQTLAVEDLQEAAMQVWIVVDIQGSTAADEQRFVDADRVAVATELDRGLGRSAAHDPHAGSDQSTLPLLPSARTTFTWTQTRVPVGAVSVTVGACAVPLRAPSV